MVPRFEKRVRAYAMEISAVTVVLIIVTFAIRNIYLKVSLVAACYLLLSIVPLLFGKGQTFGKRIQNIKVVNLNGSDAKVVILVLRELFKTFANLLTFGIYSIVAYFALTEKEVSRTVHDYIFKTKVIDLTKPKKYDRDDHFLKTSESLKKKGL